ncbi:MAG: hypothetical protein RMI04_09555 [Thermofilaceae archaeon]|nr:hypothetical protein [Thermofilaceae archaeon]
MEKGGVWEYLRRRYGKLPYPETYTLSIPEKIIRQVARENPDRIQLLVVNNGDYPVYLNFFPDVSEISGIRLQEKGGILSLFVDEDGILPTFALYAYSPFGPAYLFIVEIKLAGE